ncbi:MAG TPA: rhodanese-like domain-containing protein [Sediminibacterium sp.]|nr:rhodanese-like domain-containing protein [Sediminibacterium sp.]
MNKIWSRILILLAFAGCRADAQEALTVPAFEQAMQQGHPQLLDVRTAGEFQTGHLANALQADWLNQSQFADRVQYLDKQKPVLVYCASGVRSAAAAKWLQQKGFTDVKSLAGGLTAWKLQGKPIASPDAKPQMSQDTYQSLIQSADVVLVDFGAAWCPPCRQMEPVLEKLQKSYAGKFKLIKVDGGNDIAVMKAQEVSALPVFIVYKKGRETWRKQGVVSLEELGKQL